MKADRQIDKLGPEKIIKSLKKNEISVWQVPKAYEQHPKVLAYERKTGLRITGRRGFDVISNSFFVEEELVYTDRFGQQERKLVCTNFGEFEAYYTYLDGEIYENACYAYYCLPKHMISSFKIDVKKLMRNRAFVEDTVDDYSLEMSPTEQKDYAAAENRHKQLLQWSKRVNACSSVDKLTETLRKISSADTAFFLSNYIFYDVKDKKRFSIVMQYLSSCNFLSRQFINALCTIYDPDEVYNAYNDPAKSQNTVYKHKRMLRKFIQSLKTGQVEFVCDAYFDEKTHYYCEKRKGYTRENKRVPAVQICRYFENFESFISYRKGDLTHCNLLSANLNVDFSKYRTDQTTKLPRKSYRSPIYSVSKWFHGGKFHVVQRWTNEQQQVIKIYEHSFVYFFDFVAFLKGDLSGANLILCEGLKNLPAWASLDFSKVKLTSDLYRKWGIQYKAYQINPTLVKSFGQIQKNEQQTAMALQNARNFTEEAIKQNITPFDAHLNHKCQRVSYISDIHLMHKLQDAKVDSQEDVFSLIQKYVDAIALETSNLLLIDGDTSSDFTVFQWFVKQLSRALKPDVITVFTLGNHELWGFPVLEVDEIVTKYRMCLSENGMYLLQNDLLYVEDTNESHFCPKQNVHVIPYDELSKMGETELFDRLRYARYTILGGLGFSGYNKHFNADSGIYFATIDRETDIQESQKFETLYLRLLSVLGHRNTIILTHTPKKDWSSSGVLDNGVVYVSGHTHRNSFYDDGNQRLYADNQIGYHQHTVHLKDFMLENDYDCFYDYVDGIYKITGKQYRDFYRGKNLEVTFSRKVNFVYMLKKNGYYCFLIRTERGDLGILNGGAVKTLAYPNVQYYYDRMDAMIAKIENPLARYSDFQKKIADLIIRIGGQGRIHGCIIDIDFYNHIYVNPVDSAVVGYWASDIITKKVYPSVSALLKMERPDLYQNYLNFLGKDTNNWIALETKSSLSQAPECYFDTDIYRASREVRKMQKANMNILSAWYEKTILPNHRLNGEP